MSHPLNSPECNQLGRKVLKNQTSPQLPPLVFASWMTRDMEYNLAGPPLAHLPTKTYHAGGARVKETMPGREWALNKAHSIQFDLIKKPYSQPGEWQEHRGLKLQTQIHLKPINFISCR